MPTTSDDSDTFLISLPKLDSEQGPALPLSSLEARDMVLRAMESAMPAVRSRGYRRVSWFVGLAAALVASAVAAAVVVVYERQASAPPLTTSTPATPSSAILPYQAPNAHRLAPVTETTQTPATKTSAIPSVSPTQVAAPVEAPADLLKRANEARSHKQYDEALRLYDVVAKTAGGSSRSVAMLAKAQILLDHQHQVAEAKSLFAAVLQANPGPALSEEAEYGLVECARASGNTAEEISLLHAFIDHHADSFRLSAARTRLSALEK